MTSLWTAAAGVLALGACCGLTLRRRARRRPASTGRWRDRLIVGTVVSAIGAPIVLIVLAKVFASDALGWLFAISLIVDAALVPAAVIFLIGYAIGATIERKTCSPGDLYPAQAEGPHPAAGAGPMATVSPMPAMATTSATSATSATTTIALSRDSVHASDDDGHDAQVTVDSSATLHELLLQVGRMRFLPAIRGGAATWVASAGAVPVGVWAAQWDDARLLVGNTTVRGYFGEAAAALDFRYRCQDDPDAVFEQLRKAA